MMGFFYVTCVIENKYALENENADEEKLEIEEYAQNEIESENNLEWVSFSSIEKYVREKIPELTCYEQYIMQSSDGEAYMIIDNFGFLDGFIERKEDENYYLIYIGEKWSNHTANWDYFLVTEDLNQIYFFDMTENVVLTLEEWRESDYYRNLESK